MDIFEDNEDQDNKVEHADAGTYPIVPPDDTNIGPALATYGIDPQKLFHNRYRILAISGKGERGFVLYVSDTVGDNGHCALKIIFPHLSENHRSQERITRAVNLSRRLNHKNIVGIREDGRDEHGLWYYVMDYVKGKNLDQLLHEECFLDLDYPEILYILREIASALAHAHNVGIIHRDIKPSNILIAFDGHVKLTDFSIARAIEDKAGLSPTGEIVGAPNYMAPEIFKGEKLDGKCDIYSFGILAYELCTGKCPFEAPNVLALCQSLETAELPKFSGKAKKYPGWIFGFIKKCTNKNRNERYSSADEIVKFVDEQIEQLDAGMFKMDLSARLEGLRQMIKSNCFGKSSRS